MAMNRSARMGSTSRSSWASSSRSSHSSTRSMGKKPVSGYQSVWNCFNNKISSYKFLTAQTMGPAKHGRPTAASLNTFAKWIEKGAIVHKVTPTQLKRWSNTSQQFKTVSSAKTAMCKKFGKGPIKAVICNKTGGFLVATAPAWRGKSFKFPS